MGHAVLLKRCEALGEVIVGVNSDEFVRLYKKAPMFNTKERMELIRELGYTVVENNSSGRELIDQVKPDIIVIGSDWGRKDYLAQIDVTWDYLDDNNISLMYVPYTKGISSTEMKKRVKSDNNSNQPI